MSVSIGARVLAQHIVQAYRSKRQITYESRDEENDFRQHRETRLAVGLGLDIYKNVRSKAMIEKLEKLDLSISYIKLLECTAGLANAVVERSELYGGCSLPAWLNKGKFVWVCTRQCCFS